MDIKRWKQEVAEAYISKGNSYTDEIHKKLMQPGSGDDLTLEDVGNVFVEAMFARIVEKAASKGSFGEVDRVAGYLGGPLEKVYGVTDCPFMDLARSYWTFRLELADVLPDKNATGFVSCLRGVEQSFGSVFFPTPGPISIPWRKRRDAMRSILLYHDPRFNVRGYFEMNPILEYGKSKSLIGLIKRVICG